MRTPEHEVEVLYSGLIQATLGLTREKVRVNEGATALDVLRLIASHHQGLGESLFMDDSTGLVPNLIVLVDGRDIRQRKGTQTEAVRQVEIVLLPPSTGGG